MVKNKYPHFDPSKHNVDVKIAKVRASSHAKHNINYHIVFIPKFRKAVALLDFADIRLESKLRCKTISKKEYKRLKLILDNYWIHIFDFLHTNEDNKFFQENFR